MVLLFKSFKFFTKLRTFIGFTKFKNIKLFLIIFVSMNVSEIYTLVNYIANKNQSGESFRINRYNQILEILDPDFFKRKIEEFELYRRGSETPPNEAMFSSKLLRDLKRIEVVTVPGNNRINITTLTRFAYAIGMLAYKGGRYPKVEFVSDEEYDDRREDTVLDPYDDNPIATMAGNFIYLTWQGFATRDVEVTYYSYPQTPYCDYYLDVNGVMQFLDAGESHVWATREIDSLGVTHTLGDPNWASRTVELAYEIDLHWEFMMNILSAAGVKLEKPQVTQYAEAMKAEATRL